MLFPPLTSRKRAVVYEIWKVVVPVTNLPGQRFYWRVRHMAMCIFLSLPPRLPLPNIFIFVYK